jgi:threonine synthase
VVDRDAEVVAMLTGHGLKDTAYILEQHGARSPNGATEGQQEGH